MAEFFGIIAIFGFIVNLIQFCVYCVIAYFWMRRQLNRLGQYLKKRRKPRSESINS